MRIHDLQAALLAVGGEEALARRVARLAQGAELGRLANTFDLALRSGTLSHDLAGRLRRHLRALTEMEDPEPDETTQSLRDEIQTLQEKVAEHRVTRPRLVAARERIAGLEQQRVELNAVLEAIRREIKESAGQRTRLDQILTEVES